MNTISPLQTLDDWLSVLESRHPLAIDLGLERCREVWQRLDCPQPASQIFVVAGTNGKGSTVATICALLGGLGFSYGSYTTPHLLRYNERIQLNGQPVSDRELLWAFGRVEKAREGTSLSYFEFGTLAALLILSREELDFAVMEVGLGGRLDAVNLLDADCAVITPIGLDHQEYLGDDIGSIGREKAGIIRSGRTVICGEANPPVTVVEEAVASRAPLKRLGIEFSIGRVGEEVLFTNGDVELRLPRPLLNGAHQLNNMGTAVAAVLELLPAAADSDSLTRGLRRVSLPGRLQRVSRQPALWIDVGHNPMAAGAVAAAIGETMADEDIRQCRCVLGMLADKDAASVANELGQLVCAWYCAGLEGERGQTGQRLADRLATAGGTRDIRAFKNVGMALDAALADSGSVDAVLVFGSFLTASQALHHWHGQQKSRPSDGSTASVS
jgi:dihydrofolate synthase/folylpolyglutamate synthase